MKRFILLVAMLAVSALSLAQTPFYETKAKSFAERTLNVILSSLEEEDVTDEMEDLGNDLGDYLVYLIREDEDCEDFINKYNKYVYYYFEKEFGEDTGSELAKIYLENFYDSIRNALDEDL